MRGSLDRSTGNGVADTRHGRGDDLYHGGALDLTAVKFAEAPTPWVDLSTGINPWPYPVEAIDPATLTRLPTREDRDRCHAAMAAAFGAPADAMALVPGSEIAIRLLPKLIEARRVAILAPTYGDHTESWSGAGVEMVTSNDPLSFRDEVDVVVVCNPNNPDGRTFDLPELLHAAERLAARGGWLVVDEAYADLHPDSSLAPHAGAPGLIVLRSTGKFFGLPGLRLGAVLAPRSVLSGLEQLLGVWRIAGPALSIGARAYSDTPWQHAMRAQLTTAKTALDSVLVDGGVRVVGGTDLYRYIEVADAHAVWHQLCARGIYTRRFAWTRSHLRLGLPPNSVARARLLGALAVATSAT